MAILTGRAPKDTVPELLTINSIGLGSDLSAIGDGVGALSPLKLSKTQVSINDLVWPTSGATQGQFLSVGADNQLQWSIGFNKTGDAMTGNLKLVTTTETVIAVAGTTGARSIPLATGSYFTATITGATTFTFAGAPAAGDAFGFVLELKNGSAGLVTWPASVVWESATAPALSAAAVDLLVFVTRDGGATWYGSARLGS